MAITTILFDVGGVIIAPVDANAAAERYQRQAQRLGLENGDEILARFFAGEEWRAARTGGINWAQLLDAVLSPFGIIDAGEQARFAEELFEFEGVLPEMTALIRALYGRYQLGILSNASDRLEGRLDYFGLTEYFDPIVNSHRIGAAKPDEAAYQITLERLNVAADQVIFIDDRERNTVVAESLGIKCHLFTTVSELKSELESLALL